MIFTGEEIDFIFEKLYEVESFIKFLIKLIKLKNKKYNKNE